MHRRMRHPTKPSLSPTPFAYRPGRGTADSMCIFDMSKRSRPAPCVAFMDVLKAFHKINKAGLWQSLPHRGFPRG
eukprot:359295-Chlamydomonas_euryale.AAC.2